MIDQATIDALDKAGIDVSNMKSTLSKDDNLKFKVTIGDVGLDPYGYVQKNREETFTHEIQHVIIGVNDVKKDGKMDLSSGGQHRFMNSNNALIQQRFNSLKRARPDLTDEQIRKAVTNFEY